jgi:hypothetical protein
MHSLARLAAGHIHVEGAGEEEEEGEEQQTLLAAAAVTVVGAEQARLECIARRNTSCVYLAQPTLLPSPRHGTPLTALYDSQGTMDSMWTPSPVLKWCKGPLPRQ